MLPNSYWQGTQAPPARGRCAMSSSLAGVRTAWGQVATEIAPDPDITTPAWLTCLHAWFTLHGVSYETAILLNARSPGKPPAMLWGAIPVPGHPKIVQIPPVQQEVHFRIPKPSSAQVSRELARAPGSRGGAGRGAYAPGRAGGEQAGGNLLGRVHPANGRAPCRVRLGSRPLGNSLAQRIAFLQALHVTKSGG